MGVLVAAIPRREGQGVQESSETGAAVGIDLKQVAAFVADLLVYNRNAKAYPSGHPVVAANISRALQNFDRLLGGHDLFSLGVTRQHFLVGDQPLEKGNAKFADFATQLSDQGVVAITFRRGFDAAELQLFNGIINQERKQVWDAGGIEQVVRESGLRHLYVQGIDPALFVLKEEGEYTPADPLQLAVSDEHGLWERFVRSLLEGSLVSADELLVQMLRLPPAELARLVSDQFDELPAVNREQTLQAVKLLMRDLAKGAEAGMLSEQGLQKICSFFTDLSPELRREFLTKVFAGSPEGLKMGEQILSRVPGQVVLDALQEATRQEGYLPPVVMRLLQRLSSLGSAAEMAPAAPDGEVKEKLKVLFNKDKFEEFVPDAYRKVLLEIIASNELPVKAEEILGEMRHSLESHAQESHIAEVIYDLLQRGESAGEGVKRNLVELADYFVSVGDYRAIIAMCDRLGGVIAPLKAPRFLGEVLDGISQWGREKYDDIRALVKRIGEPFVTPLLERLGSEENMSLRRLYLDCLHQLGPLSRDAALARLGDERWYFVRNLLVLLRNFNEPEVVRQVKRLTLHSHPKVRAEVTRTLLYFRDPAADRLLLQELDQADPARRLSAIQLAEGCRNEQVLRRVLQIAAGEARGSNDELKVAAAKTLASIGYLPVLPLLERQLRTRKFIRGAQHDRLRLELVRLLDRFPAEKVRVLLQELAVGGHAELAQAAGEVLQAVVRRES